MPQDVGRQSERVRTLAAAAATACNEFRYDDALAFGYEALALASIDPSAVPATWDERLAQLDSGDQEAVARTATALAICTFRQADYMASLQVAQLELHVKRHLDDDAGAALAVMGLGWCYHAVGLYQQALANQFEALDTLEKIRPGAIAGPLNGIARTYLDLGQVDTALEYAQRALANSSTSPVAQRDRSTALRTIGEAHRAVGDVASARAVFQESYDSSDSYGQRLALLSLGELSTDEGLLDEAQGYFEECLKRVSPEMRELVQCEALIGLGRVYVARGQPELALVPLAEAVARGTASGAPVEAAEAHRVMSEALRSLGRWEQSLSHFQSFHDLNNRTLRQLSDRRTQILQVQLDLERVRKDREIDRLRNVELARAYADLRELHERLEAQAARLQRLTRTDDLTGLANRRAFEERLSAELLRSKRLDRPLSLLMVDLDDFKRVNDTYTHVVGDGILRAAAEAMLACTREIDMVARIGGEEFVVLLPETDVAGASSVGNKVLEAVASRTLEAHGIAITASVGLATADPYDDEASLLMRADSRLYEAKRLGKNRVEA